MYADVLRYRELFSSLVRRDLRAKYKGSVLGLAWTLALPVALMLVYLVVFSVLWKAQATDLDDYWLFLLCGLPPWAFFASSLTLPYGLGASMNPPGPTSPGCKLGDRLGAGLRCDGG